MRKPSRLGAIPWEIEVMRTREIVVIALVAIVAAAVGAGIALFFVGTTRVDVAAGAMRGEALSLNAPAGTLTTETNTAYKGPRLRALLRRRHRQPRETGRATTKRSLLSASRTSARSTPRTSAS